MKRVSQKFFLILLLIFICLSAAYLSAVSVLADDTYYTEGFFKYSINGDSVSIHSYYGNESEVEIPDHIAALPVTEIEVEAFSGNTTVTKITIPYTVTSVGKSAFSDMSRLKTIINQSEGLELEVPETVVIQEDYPVYINLDNDIVADNAATDNTSEDKQESLSDIQAAGTTKIGFEEVAEEEDDADVGIDAGNGSYVTVDNTDNLIVVDKDNNITVIDRNHTYRLTTDENGHTIITDENENQVRVSDNGEITFKDDLGNSVTKNTAGEIVSGEGIADVNDTNNTSDTDGDSTKDSTNNTDKESNTKIWKCFAAIGVIAVILALVVILIRKKKNKVSDSSEK